MAATPYPLAWPLGRPRRLASARKFGRFTEDQKDITIYGAISRLRLELVRLGAEYIVISSNVETRNDGLPRSGAREPSDPGVAVYFQLIGKPICMPCDTYNRVAQNLAAVAAHVAATRAIERHGVATVAEMFSGFVALPPSHRDWWDVLECRRDATRAVIEAQFRRLARDHHPDRGGSHAQMSEINRARDEALKEVRS